MRNEKCNFCCGIQQFHNFIIIILWDRVSVKYVSEKRMILA